jgi:hypothetical protein
VLELWHRRNLPVINGWYETVRGCADPEHLSTISYDKASAWGGSDISCPRPPRLWHCAAAARPAGRVDRRFRRPLEKHQWHEKNPPAGNRRVGVGGVGDQASRHEEHACQINAEQGCGFQRGRSCKIGPQGAVHRVALAGGSRDGARYDRNKGLRKRIRCFPRRLVPGFLMLGMTRRMSILEAG